MKRLTFLISLAALAILTCTDTYAQRYAERKHIRSGNSLYEKGDYTGAETDYIRARELNPESYEANFNLANTLYKQERYDEAAQAMQKLANDSTRLDYSPAALYNMGNALFQHRKLEEALEAYKESLRRNPDDMEAKFNLAYVQKLLEKEDENNDGGGGGGGDNQDDQNNQDGQNEPDDPNGGQGDPEQGEGDPEQEQGDPEQGEGDPEQEQGDPEDGEGDPEQEQGDPGNEEGQQPPPQGGMSREDADQLLDAMQVQEDNTKEKVDARRAAGAAQPGKNW